MKLVKVLLSALFVVAIATGCPKKEDPKPVDGDAAKKKVEEAACKCGKEDCAKCKAAKAVPAPVEK